VNSPEPCPGQSLSGRGEARHDRTYCSIADQAGVDRPASRRGGEGAFGRCRDWLLKCGHVRGRGSGRAHEPQFGKFLSWNSVRITSSNTSARPPDLSVVNEGREARDHPCPASRGGRREEGEPPAAPNARMADGRRDDGVPQR